MANDQVLEVHINPEAQKQTHKAFFEAIQELFEIDVKGSAVELSPVKRGTNRRSIDTEVVNEGVNLFGQPQIKASIFTQSGYGGYLELGTRYIQGFHYLYKAIQRNMGKLPGLIQAKLRN